MMLASIAEREQARGFDRKSTTFPANLQIFLINFWQFLSKLNARKNANIM